MGEVPYPVQYKNVKAKCVELITEVEELSDMSKKFLYTVILQFSDSIYASFMCKPGIQTDVTQFINAANKLTRTPDGNIESDINSLKVNDHPIVKLKMIRGYNQNLYFA